jgi:hypothetical protein
MHRSELESMVRESYAGFNARNAEVAAQGLSPDVEWPDQLEGGTIVGREAVIAYWRRQWKTFDPTMEPLQLTWADDGDLVVNVRQVLKGPGDIIIVNGFVRHIYTFRDGLAVRLQIRY